MPTDQLFNQYKGESIPSFDGNPANNGQCEQWYLMVRTKRDGLPVVSGNAIDRWYNQEPQYNYISFGSGVYPKKDDYVVWGAGVGSSAGHVDVCAQDGNANGFLGYDSNWSDSKILQEIQHNYGFGILGYVRFKGATMIENEQQNDLVFLVGVSRHAEPQEVGRYIGQSWEYGLNDILKNADRLKQDTIVQQNGQAKAIPRGLYIV